MFLQNITFRIQPAVVTIENRAHLANFAAELIQVTHAVDHPYNLVCSCSHRIFVKFCCTVALKLPAFSFIVTKGFVTKVTHALLVCINLKQIIKLPPRYNCTISCKYNVSIFTGFRYNTAAQSDEV